MDARNLHDAILKEVVKDRIPVTLFLMNGFQLRGIITGYDSFVVVLVTEGKQQMIYYHGKWVCLTQIQHAAEWGGK